MRKAFGAIMLTFALALINASCAAAEEYVWDLSAIYANEQAWEDEYVAVKSALAQPGAADRAVEIAQSLERLLLYPQLELYVNVTDTAWAEKLALVQSIDAAAIFEGDAPDTGMASLTEIDARIEAIRTEYMRLSSIGNYADYADEHVRLLSSYITAQTERAKLLGYGSVLEMALPDITPDALDMANGYARQASLAIWSRERAASETVECTFSNALDAIYALADEYGAREYLSHLTNDGHVDAYPRDGKVAGSFTAVWQGEPYILLNFTGTPDSVSNAAHEYAHALCDAESKGRGVRLTTLQQETSALAFELRLLSDMADTSTGEHRETWQAALLNTISSSYCTQGMYAEFERALYDMAWDGGELDVEYIAAQWRLAHMNWRGVDAADDYNWALLSQLYYSYYSQLYVPAAGCAISAQYTEPRGSALIDIALSADYGSAAPCERSSINICNMLR